MSLADTALAASIVPFPGTGVRFHACVPDLKAAYGALPVALTVAPKAQTVLLAVASEA
jgi:hypothetical protein